MRLMFGIVLVVAAAFAAVRGQSAELDLVIRGGRIVDGTGNPSFDADLGIKDGRIVALGRVSASASRTIDASGLVVAHPAAAADPPSQDQVIELLGRLRQAGLLHTERAAAQTADTMLPAEQHGQRRRGGSLLAWRVPLGDGAGRAVLVEDLRTDPRTAALAAVFAGDRHPATRAPAGAGGPAIERRRSL